MKILTKKDFLNNKFIGSIGTFLLTFLFFLFFFGSKILTNIDTNFFSISSSDLIKDIYTTSYYVKYDSTYVRNNPMNYPYGEHYKYTGNQTFISIPLKFIKNIGLFDFSDKVLLFINLHVILSIFLCSLFLYLLFRELKLPNIVSILSAVMITFLSPQLQRIGGHLTLSYAFIIPLILFLLAKNYTAPRLLYSILLGILLIWSGLAHPYYMLFFVALCTVNFIYISIYEKSRFGGIKKTILIYSIQILIPLVLFFLLSGIGDFATDRSKIPYGFYVYKGNLYGVLLPYPQAYFKDLVKFFPTIQWGAQAYIGIVSIITLVVIIIKLFKSKFVSFLKITDHKLLNLFFWTAILLLIFACGIPLICFPKNVLNYIGPIAQLRAVGRYAWLFYYVINIVSVYLIFNILIKKINKKWLRYAIMCLTFSLFFVENYFYAKDFKNWYTKNYAEWTDYKNTLKQNLWVHHLNPNDYQSILPLPVFNVGSEHLYANESCNAFKKSAYVSYKTGLPMFNNFSSRSSITQAYHNIAFAWEPWIEYPVLKDLKNEKPILVIKPSDCESLNPNEKRIIDYSDSLFSANNIDFYKLEIADLYQLCRDFQHELQQQYELNKCFQHAPTIYSNDSVPDFYMQTWDHNNTDKSFQGQGALKGRINKVNILYDDIIPFSERDKIEFSFWISNYTDDLYGRSYYKISILDTNNRKKTLDQREISRRVIAISNGWGLIKTTLQIPQEAYKLHISVSNDIITAKPVYFDNLLMRPLHTNVISEDNTLILFNNIPVSNENK